MSPFCVLNNSAKSSRFVKSPKKNSLSPISRPNILVMLIETDITLSKCSGNNKGRRLFGTQCSIWSSGGYFELPLDLVRCTRRGYDLASEEFHESRVER